MRIRKGFNPEPLGAPIGLELEPQPGQDHYNLGETLDEKAKEYRRLLLRKYAKPYMRDFRNLDVHRGKFYVANNKLWRSSASLYFPNLQGQTLADESLQDTTPTLQGKISLVGVWSRTWAMEQADTFTKDPAIRAAIAESGGKAQVVQVTWEEQKLYALMMKMFQWNLKRSIAENEWSKFFIMSGIPLDVKDSLAMANDRVGNVYLLDENCKIRWTGCGDAWDEEKESLAKGIRKLVSEHRGR
jgi:ATPase complex subunit ATP10